MNHRPAIFYAPHCDDEALGMGGAMAQAKLAGRPVILVLVSDSRASPRANELFGNARRCTIHGAWHDYPDINLDQYRREEFARAGAVLGVDDIITLDLPEAYPPAHFVSCLGAEILLLESKHPGSTHHFVSGARDEYGPDETNPIHRSCTRAVEMVEADLTEVFMYRVYVYGKPTHARTADEIVGLSPEAFALKRAALEVYREWRPPERIAYGFHSVPQLFMGAGSDPREFVDYIR